MTCASLSRLRMRRLPMYLRRLRMSLRCLHIPRMRMVRQYCKFIRERHVTIRDRGRTGRRHATGHVMCDVTRSATSDGMIGDVIMWTWLVYHRLLY